VQRLQLTGSADELAVEVACEAACPSDDRAQTVCANRLRLAFQRQGSSGLDPCRTARKQSGPLAYEGLTRRCGLLEALSDVDGIARCQGAVATLRARNNLPCVDTDPDCEASSKPALELVVQRAQTLVHLRRSQ
jgi:hypothetical protein